MEIAYETNGHGFMGWPADLPGAFVRAATMAQVRAKLDCELHAWSAWLNQAAPTVTTWHESTVTTAAVIDDGDSEILLDTDRRGYPSQDDLANDCVLLVISAAKVDLIQAQCRTIADKVDPAMVRTTFYGPTFATTAGQYRHIIDTQHYYLQNLGVDAQWNDGPLVNSRQAVAQALVQAWRRDGNRVLTDPGGDEEWSIRKVARRLIVHDRLHARAMNRMRQRLENPH